MNQGDTVVAPTPVLRSTADAVTYLTRGTPGTRGRRLATYRLFNLKRVGVLTGYRDAKGACMWDLREVHRCMVDVV